MLMKKIHFLSLGLSALMLISCGGSSNDSITSTPISVTAPPPPSPPPSGSLPTVPPVLANPSVKRPSLDMALLGDPVVYLSIGDEYIEMGVNAFDESGEDVSSSVEVSGNLNTDIVGDYLLKYSASSDGLSGTALRIVRVEGVSPVRQTHRLSASTNANLSYLEHLPIDFGKNTNLKPPLIIFNHGSGATGTRDLSDVECCGLPNVLRASSWDESLPFVILSPQRNSGINYEDLNDFIEFALEHYDVDPNRVYMTGWSQGANISILYAIAYPEKIAALAPTAGALFNGIPENICAAESIPMWMYLGGLDLNTIENAGIATVNSLNNCPQGERKMLTTYTNAGHFDTSIWPYLRQDNRQIDANSDANIQNILEIFLSLDN